MNYALAEAEIRRSPSWENACRLAKDIVKEMTLEEKISFTSGVGKLAFYAPTIAGKLLHQSFFYYTFQSRGCRRLGIPQIRFTDGPRGVVTGESTCFPAAVMRAASFDDELEEQVAEVMAKEALAAGANFFAGICLNVARNPHWGRCQESYGEDPFLIGRKGAIYTKVMQEHGIIACPKHFALNSIENLRFCIDVDVDERTLREVYLPHFQKCIDAGTRSVMSAYNQLRGSYCGENRELLTTILREEMGFEGFVMTDFIFGIYDAKRSYAAGLDLEMPMNTVRNRKTVRDVQSGEIPEEQVTAAAEHILAGMLDVLPKRDPSFGERRNEQHMAIARRAAEEGTVLLRNNGILPLSKNASVAVVGSFADLANTGDEGSSFVRGNKSITPYAGLKEQFRTVTLSQGNDVACALSASESADAVLVVVGSDKYREGECLDNDVEKLEKDLSGLRGGDRASLRLTDEEIHLIHALKQAGRKVIVSMLSGSVFLTDDFEDDTDALLMSFYGGCEGGRALARILSGEVNPSGKMPFTVACKESDYPEFRYVGQKPYKITYGYYHGYTLFDKENKPVRYPFGYGLSYTSFSISGESRTDTEDGIIVTADVTNTGLYAGAEVIQVYAGSDQAAEDRPVRLLKGYERITLAPGETRSVRIFIPWNDLRFYHPESREWSLDAHYAVWIGNSSRNLTAVREETLL